MAVHSIRVTLPGDMGGSRLSGKTYHIDMRMPNVSRISTSHIGTTGPRRKKSRQLMFTPHNISAEDQAKNLIAFRAINHKPITGSAKEAGMLAPEAQQLYSKLVTQAHGQGITFAPTQKDKGGFINRALDILSRASYASANVGKEVFGKGNIDAGDLWKASWEGLTGKKKGSWNEIFHNRLLGLAGDILLDPSTYVGVGVVGDVGKGVKSAKSIAEGLRGVSDTAKAAGATIDIADAVSRIGIHPSNRAKLMDIFRQAENEAEASRLLTDVKPKVDVHRTGINTWLQQVMNPRILKFRGDHLSTLSDMGDTFKTVLGSRAPKGMHSSDLAHALINERRLTHGKDGRFFRQVTSGMSKAGKQRLRDVIKSEEDLYPEIIDDMRKTAGQTSIIDQIPNIDNLLGIKSKDAISGGKIFEDNPELFQAVQDSGHGHLADEAKNLFDDAMKGPEGSIITEALNAVEKMQPRKAIALRAGHAKLPIVPLPKNASIWHAAEKAKLFPGAPGSAVAGLERYFRSLRSAHPALGDIYSARHANISQMNQEAFNRLKSYWDTHKITRHQDKQMLDYFSNSAHAPDELHTALTHEISMMAKAVMQGSSHAEDTKAYWKSFANKINAHLPQRQKINMANFEQGAFKNLKNKDPFTQDDFKKAIVGSDLVTNGKYLSNVIAAMHIATNGYTHSGALVEGAKAFGSSNKNLRAKGWRELSSKDFAGSGDWNSYINMFRDSNKQRLLFHPDDIKGIVQMYDYVKRPVQSAKVFEDISRIQRGWKALVTSYNFPGYYTRNTVGDIMMNHMNGLVNPRFYRDAFKMLAYSRDLRKNKQFLAHMTPGNTFTDVMRTWAGGSKNAVISDIGGHKLTILDYIREYIVRGLGSTQTEEELLRKSGVGASGVGAISGKAGKLHQTVLELSNSRDNIPRLANFVHSVERALKSGSTLEDAFSVGADAVRRYNFDFSDFSPLELKAANVFPFYRYMRRSIPNAMRIMAAHPMRWEHWNQAQEAMGTDMQDPVTPWYLRSQPFATIGQRSGDTAYFKLPNPITDVLSMAEGPGPQGFNQPTAKALLDSIMQNISPIGKIPYQAVRGESLSGRPFNESDISSSFGLLGKLLPGGSINKSLAYENAKRGYGNYPDTGLAGQVPQWLLPLLLQDVQYNTGKKQKGELARWMNIIKQMQTQKSPTKNTPEKAVSSMFPWAT